ncbi:hypothetical protein [Pelagicoccus sp. SDUM812003]|uniref:hypothetical protein n=1 Tax=Pelagicoccus sp. SDUM812003 TaxID=3041267 RepID=UPI00280E563B|nr:hypothetical protein [Pelagicoccus sp. SDUM812003]MDQ8205730.1 hypothetical protein [Pelagicoccus sp. SDUM812003]
MTNPQPGPISDLDSTFSVISPTDTPKVMEALRKEGIEFDVTVNTPKEDPNDEEIDIFWFRKEANQDKIGEVIRKVLKNEK